MQRKALSVSFGVIFIGLALFVHMDLWGASWKFYDTTDSGYIFHPKHSNGRALVYCHGGFGQIHNPDLPNVDYFVSRGWTVLVLRYVDETGKPLSIQGDVQEAMEVIRSLKVKFGKVDLIGISRGGFVALQIFVRYGKEIEKCVAVVAPIHIQSWEQAREMTLEQQQYFKGLDDPYEYVQKMSSSERFELGKKLLLLYGSKDDLVPASQGMEFAEKTKCKLIQVEGGHALFHKRENERLAEEFLLN
jgi:dipeptidyl aminopeptidase/acylaminoacyl peptidase